MLGCRDAGETRENEHSGLTHGLYDWSSVLGGMDWAED